MAAPRPASIRKKGGERLTIGWSDGTESAFTARELRIDCRCAACRSEWSGERILKPESVPADIRIEAAEPVGNYALSFRFSDGHATGIYPFEYLYELKGAESKPKES